MSNMGFSWAWEGFRRVQGWIPIHLDQVAPKQTILGPFLIFDFLDGAQIAPQWSQASLAWFWDHLGPWVHVGRRPTFMEAEGRL